MSDFSSLKQAAPGEEPPIRRQDEPSVRRMGMVGAPPPPKSQLRLLLLFLILVTGVAFVWQLGLLPNPIPTVNELLARFSAEEELPEPVDPNLGLKTALSAAITKGDIAESRDLLGRLLATGDDTSQYAGDLKSLETSKKEMVVKAYEDAAY